MNIINREVVSAYKHLMLCTSIIEKFHSTSGNMYQQTPVEAAMYKESVLASDLFVEAVEEAYKSQVSLQKEIDEINLDQIGLDL